MNLSTLLRAPVRIAQLELGRRQTAQRLRHDVAQLQKELAVSPQALLRAQSDRLQDLVLHAVATCPYWRDRFDASGVRPAGVSGIGDLSALPILEKADVRRHRERMISTAFPPAKRLPAATGGSTAAPMRFYRDADCLWQREVGKWLFLNWMGRDPADRWALVWGAMCDMGSAGSFRQRWFDYVTQRYIALPGNQLTAANLDAFARRIRRHRVRFVHGYSQSIWLLARRILETQTRLLPINCVSLTAEPITDAQRDDIERAFDCPAFSIYGAREFGYVSSECPGQFGLHINPLNCIVEFLRTDGTSAAAGELGQIVITDLYNRAMPLLRYRIGDIGARMDDNATGSLGLPRMELSAGRETDFVVTASGRFISGVTIAQLNRPGFSQLQYWQQERGHATVRYVRNDDFHGDSLRMLQEHLHGTFGTDFRFEFEEIDEVRALPSGKLRYVYSEVARKELSLN